MKKILIFVLLVSIQAIVWAGFPLENFNGTWPSPLPYTGTATFNGNHWSWRAVDRYISGSDYEMVVSSELGRITSHYFENGVGIISFTAAKTTSNETKIKVTFSVDGNNFVSIYYNYDYYVTVSSTTPTTYTHL